MKAFVTQQVFEDSGLYLMGRGRAPSGSNFVQADISAIELKIFDKGDPTATLVVPAITVAVADTVFNTLQTDDRWTIDETGYNFRYETLPAHLPAGGKVYRFEFKFTPATGQVFYAVFEVPTLGLYGS